MAKIFIAEDDEKIIRIYREAFTLKGHNVTVATDGNKAIEMLREMELKPAVVLTDMMMPGMSGFEVIDKIKAESSLKGVPVVVLTNMTSLANGEADIQKLKEMGIKDILIKSEYDAREVVERVEEIIEKSMSKGL
jgi:CheY-like chemotaxis protein